MSTLVDKQAKFAKLISQLILEISKTADYQVVIGEVLRTPEQQAIYVKEGKSKTSNSKHIDKLAADLILYKVGVYLTKKEDYQFAGNIWKSLDVENVWGGDWGWDANHFQHTK